MGVTGSIAAYKAVILCRELIKSGAEVKVVMTPDATQFVTPLTFNAISHNEVYCSIATDAGQWNEHVHLGLWADLMIIAPTTANTLAKMAHGICDNILLATYLSAKCHVMIAPAMDLDMWHHATTQQNLKTLKKNKNQLIPVGHGALASGLVGDGRMAEPNEIIKLITDFFLNQNQILALKQKKILINAGPTYEPIDPVRFIGNYSSGKMGLELAIAAASLGADVQLVIGPNSLMIPDHINTTLIQDSDEMYDKCTQIFTDVDIAICAAAVADYKPKQVKTQKIKKKKGLFQLELIKTKDTLAQLGKLKKQNQFLVGFALETQNALEYGQEKLYAKNLDMIIVNTPTPNTGFGTDTNQVIILQKDKKEITLRLDSKREIAYKILSTVMEALPK